MNIASFFDCAARTGEEADAWCVAVCSVYDG